MNKSDTRFTVWGSTELLLLEFEGALEISQKLPHLTKLPQNYLPALLDPNPEAPTLMLPLEGICSTTEIMLANTTPHLCNCSPEKALWGNKYSFMLNQKYISDLLLQLQVIKLALYPFLSIFLTYLSGWVYSLVKHCQLGHAPALPQPPESAQAAVWPGYQRVPFLLEQPWGHKLQCGVLWAHPSYSMGRTGDSSPLREHKIHLNSFLGHIKNELPSCKDWITASTLTVWAVWRFMMSFN